MDENNNVMSNGATPETSTPSTTNDYVIGGPATPVVETAPVVEPTPAAETAPATETAPVAETAPATEPTSATEPTPVAPPSTASIYEQANSAAINPTTENKVVDTPIYTTTPAVDPMASYSVPPTPTYASTDSASTNTTYTSSSTYTSTTTETTASTGLATASLILGIISIVTGCCCCGNILFSIAGIICSILQKPLEDGKKPGTATAGLITSIVGVVMAVITLIAYVILAAES